MAVGAVEDAAVVVVLAGDSSEPQRVVLKLVVGVAVDAFLKMKTKVPTNRAIFGFSICLLGKESNSFASRGTFGDPGRYENHNRIGDHADKGTCI